jgi:peptidoglycan/xylan/chitin deacetylase (PgdA/CDA1 family)
MPLWKQLLLSLYYHATYPARAWYFEREASAGHLPAIVLCWHRIADDGANPWTISNAMFIRQIRWLSRNFQFVSLEEAQRRIGCNCGKGDSPRPACGRCPPERPEGCFAQMGTVPFSARPCVSVTFDDGYADNCRQAMPLLIRERIPCTYFVTLRNVAQEEPFSHDLAMGHRLAPNTLEQLRSLAAAGVEIGAHGYTHADLGVAADHNVLHREIVAARQRLQAAVDRPVRYFAFPYGQYANLSPAAFELAKEAGYAGVCSAYGGFNFPGDDPFHLQRIIADGVMVRLKNWVTMDPRKLRTRRFQYQGPRKNDEGQMTKDEGSPKSEIQMANTPSVSELPSSFDIRASSFPSSLIPDP